MIDPEQVKTEQRRSWNAISAGWDATHEIFERGGAALTRRLLDLADVRPGRRVLDVATGIGEPALNAAAAVGPGGCVVGVDISPAMLAVARRRARLHGCRNVAFAEGDVEHLGQPEGAFDVVLSRLGLMFAVDHVAAFRGLRAVLVPGGVLAAAVWAEPEAAPMMSLGYRVLADRLDLPSPPPGLPGPFSMSDPGRLAADLIAAGFQDVSVTAFTVPFRLDGPGEYVEITKAMTPPRLLGLLRDRYGSEDDPATWEAVGAAVAPFAAGGVIPLPSTALCVRAVAP
ncbi:class I SAM-dependent methyltransferase [Actinomadura sp. NPDC047616]|uniref:class I SAM-dependent methyltransferase n=1 Tax=Actinomadura sp. NPDC047616 TaxID=3155914 RepID=UPI0033D2FF48